MSIVGKISQLFLDKEKTQPAFPVTKTKAVTNDKGENLDAIMQKYQGSEDGVVGNSDRVGGKMPGELGVNIDLLWENSVPTNSFPKQTIEIPEVSKYNLFLILTVEKSNEGGYGNCYIICKTDKTQMLSFSAGLISYRPVKFVSNGIYFREGNLTSGYGKPEQNDNVQVPLKVFGIK